MGGYQVVEEMHLFIRPSRRTVDGTGIVQPLKKEYETLSNYSVSPTSNGEMPLTAMESVNESKLEDVNDGAVKDGKLWGASKFERYYLMLVTKAKSDIDQLIVGFKAKVENDTISVMKKKLREDLHRSLTGLKAGLLRTVLKAKSSCEDVAKAFGTETSATDSFDEDIIEEHAVVPVEDVKALSQEPQGETKKRGSLLQSIARDFDPDQGDQKILRAIGRTALVNAVVLLSGPLHLAAAAGFVTGGAITAKRLWDGLVNQDDREVIKSMAVYGAATGASIAGQAIAVALMIGLVGASLPVAGAVAFGVGCCSGITAGALSEWTVDEVIDKIKQNAWGLRDLLMSMFENEGRLLGQLHEALC